MPIRLAQAIWISPDSDAPARFHTSPGRLAPPPGRAIFSMLSKAAIGRNRSQRANLFQPDRHVILFENRFQVFNILPHDT